MLAFHFTDNTKRLRFGDNRVVRIGRTLKVKNPNNRSLVLCKFGMHASENLLDALKYAPGFYVWRVELDDKTLIKDSNKCVAATRKAISGCDAKVWISKFAYWCSRRAKKHANAANAANTANAANAAVYAAAAAATYAAVATAAVYAAAAAATYAAVAATYAAEQKEIQLQEKVLHAYIRKAGLKF